MAALAPPPNGAGIPLPPVPSIPPLLADITNAKEYVERLSASKVAATQQPATDHEIGAAELYKAAIVTAHAPVLAAPPWSANLHGIVQQMAADIAQLHINMQQMAADITQLRQKTDELPVILANVQAGNRGPLRNPTAMVHGWAPLLIAPNPQTRDELLVFTVAECIALAASLGLPALPPATVVQERRRQIAGRIGVTIEL